MTIYVGNLSPATSGWKLRKAFEKFGKVDKITLDNPSATRDTYCFSFINMPFESQALRAIRELDGKLLDGSPLTVKESSVTI